MSSKLHYNKRLWQKHVIAENKRDIPGLLATLNDFPVYEIMATGLRYEGPEGVTGFYQGLFDGMPDADFELVSVTVDEHMVVEESVFKGTHTGPLFELPPSGNFITFPLIIMFPVDGDKFAGERMYFDMQTLLRQMGYDYSVVEQARDE
jgi:steroid delta-isomerase-like uncharacterized protein